MGMILSGIAVAVAIGFGAGYFFLNSQEQLLAWQVYSSTSTRVSDPGYNLVGRDWSGEARPGGDADTSS